MSRRTAALLASLLSLSAAGAGAQARDEDDQPIQELFVGETVFVQDRNEVQLTSRLDFRKNADEKVWVAAQLVQYGLTDRLELDAQVPFVSGLESLAIRSAGVGDAELGLLLGLARHIHAGSLSVGVRVRLPTGVEAKGHGEGETVVEPIVIVARAFRKLEVHGSGEVGFANKNMPKEWTYGGGAILPTGRFRETIELDARFEGGEHRVLLTPGVYLKPTRAFEVGVGVPVGLTQRSPDVGAIVVATLEFGGR